MRRSFGPLLALGLSLCLFSGCSGSGSGGGGNQQQGTNPTPHVDSVSPASITAGAAAQMITVSGDRNGLPAGASVLWNGVVDDTMFVDAQHLSVAVPASEVAGAARISVMCRNPGSGDSAVTVNVQ